MMVMNIITNTEYQIKVIMCPVAMDCTAPLEMKPSWNAFSLDKLTEYDDTSFSHNHGKVY